jgi:hypothetical protein
MLFAKPAIFYSPGVYSARSNESKIEEQRTFMLEGRSR